jgi:hypothetical protein
MSFKIPMSCADDWGKEPLHFITVNDDGTLTLENHDAELEAALVELGAPTPRCIRGFLNYQNDPFGLLSEIDNVFRYYKGGKVCSGESFAVTTFLACDFARHSFYCYIAETAPEHYARHAEAALEAAAELFSSRCVAYLTGSWPGHIPDSTAHLRKLRDRYIASVQQIEIPAASFEYAERQAPPYRLFDKVLHPLNTIILYSLTEHQVRDQTKALARNARFTVFALNLDDALEQQLQKDERAWQIKHMVAAITSVVEEKPWPSVEPGGS